MEKSLSRLWILIFVVQCVFVNGQSQTIEKRLSDDLGKDQASLVVSNRNHTDPLVFMYNKVVCEQCDFDRLTDPLPSNINRTLMISSTYPYDFQLYSAVGNATIQCQIQSYRFSEHGVYLFEVIQLPSNQSSCSITQIQDSGYYWTPIIVMFLYLFALVSAVQVAQVIYKRRTAGVLLTNTAAQREITRVANSTPQTSPINIRRSLSVITEEPHEEDEQSISGSTSALPLVGATHLPESAVKPAKLTPKRLRALDTFRGFSLMVMIFVNYGGGGYWFFDHSVWNGLTLADLVFPWFVWMMGASVVLSQRSLLKKKVSRRSIFLKICRRTCTLFLLGLLLQGGFGKPKVIRILGVLQRLALCYFFTASIILIFSEADDQPQSSPWLVGRDVQPPMRIELRNTLFQFWSQWLCIVMITLTWTLITFVPKLDNCPRGYVGPGGKHLHGLYQNCTGGVAGYLDRSIMGESHLYGYPTCKEIYETKVPYDPEGLLGILTGILLCYLGAHAGHSFVHSTSVRRVCAQWIASGCVCGFLGLLLSKGGQSDSWVPINKNLWSLSFIFVLAGLAFIILTVLYLLVDVKQWFTGEPWLWLGMNSIVIYVGHDLCDQRFPVQFEVNDTHKELLAMHVYGVTWWIVVAGIMYYKKVFIAI